MPTRPFQDTPEPPPAHCHLPAGLRVGPLPPHQQKPGHPHHLHLLELQEGCWEGQISWVAWRPELNRLQVEPKMPPWTRWELTDTCLLCQAYRYTSSSAADTAWVPLLLDGLLTTCTALTFPLVVRLSSDGACFDGTDSLTRFGFTSITLAGTSRRDFLANTRVLAWSVPSSGPAAANCWRRGFVPSSIPIRTPAASSHSSANIQTCCPRA